MIILCAVICVFLFSCEIMHQLMHHSNHLSSFKPLNIPGHSMFLFCKFPICSWWCKWCDTGTSCRDTKCRDPKHTTYDPLWGLLTKACSAFFPVRLHLKTIFNSSISIDQTLQIYWGTIFQFCFFVDHLRQIK